MQKLKIIAILLILLGMIYNIYKHALKSSDGLINMEFFFILFVLSIINLGIVLIMYSIYKRRSNKSIDSKSSEL
jgi:cbb3-type cytochrome oxidase subunit 3